MTCQLQKCGHLYVAYNVWGMVRVQRRKFYFINDHIGQFHSHRNRRAGLWNAIKREEFLPLINGQKEHGMGGKLLSPVLSSYEFIAIRKHFPHFFSSAHTLNLQNNQPLNNLSKSKAETSSLMSNCKKMILKCCFKISLTFM